MLSFLIAIAVVAIQFILIAMSSAKKYLGSVVSEGPVEASSSSMVDEVEFEEENSHASVGNEEMFIPYADYTDYEKAQQQNNARKSVDCAKTVLHTSIMNGNNGVADAQVLSFRDSFNLRDAVLYQTIMTAPYCNI